jgi:hypothetical protein
LGAGGHANGWDYRTYAISLGGSLFLRSAELFEDEHDCANEASLLLTPGF